MLVESTLRAIRMHSEFYERAATFRGRPRECMVALGEADELFIRLYPQHYRALQVVRIASQLMHPASPRENALQRCESRVTGLLSAVIRRAMNTGDLVLPEPQHPDELAFTTWALAFGCRALLNTTVATLQLGIADGAQVLRRSADLLFDALDWRPRSCDWDYEHTRWRVHTELFADEWHAAFAA